MVNEEILGGLRSAMERGHTLEKAMITLFNSGYKRKDIEEAAVALLEANRASQLQEASKDKSKKEKSKLISITPISPASYPSSQPPRAPGVLGNMPGQTPTSFAITTPIKEVYVPGQRTVPASAPIQRQMPAQQAMQNVRPIQRVSEYGTGPAKEASKGKGSIILLIVVLTLLIGAFAAIFVFKDQFIAFLNNLFA